MAKRGKASSPRAHRNEPRFPGSWYYDKLNFLKVLIILFTIPTFVCNVIFATPIKIWRPILLPLNLLN